MFLLMGSATAVDVPFVFDRTASEVADYTPSQLERASSSSIDLAGVPSISQPGNEILEFPIVGGSSAPEGNTEKRVDDLKKTVSSRVEPDNSIVHEVALLLVAKFPGDLTVDQICSIYRYMKDGEGSVKGWSYARDPRGFDYFMYANQSLNIGLKASCSGVGDCDDFAILMSALVESIGGTTRIIFAQNKTMGGHAYAEVYLGNLSDQNCQIDEIISWLKQKLGTDKIYTHIDTDSKDVWLNLDWGTDEKGIAHPGGPFFKGDRHIVVYARDQFGKTFLRLPETKKEETESIPAVPLNITTDEIEKNSDYVWFNKGVALSSLGKYDEAISAYDEVIKLNPKFAFAWTNKAAALVALKRFDEALQAADKAIELDPTRAMAWNNKAAALIALKRFDEALQAADKAIELDPTRAMAWNNKAVALSNLNRNDEAQQAADKAIELDPTKAPVWDNKAGTLGNLNRHDAALQAADKAIELDPTMATAWSNKAAALIFQNRFDEALQAADKAIELDPTMAVAWNNKATALCNLKRFDEGLQAFEKATMLDPNHPGYWANKGEALIDLGRYNEALDALNEAIDLNLNFADAWNNKGKALKALGRTAEAEVAFAKAKELGYSG